MPLDAVRSGDHLRQPDVAEVINKNTQAVPSFLRAAKDLSPEQWEALMRQVEDMKGK